MGEGEQRVVWIVGYESALGGDEGVGGGEGFGGWLWIDVWDG